MSVASEIRKEDGMTVKSYRDLDVWQKAVDLVVDCYALTERFPRQEVCGLTSQMQRAAVSVPANTAEGQGRSSRKEFLHHLSIAHGSLAELETHLEIATRLGYVQAADLEPFLSKAASVGRMLNGLRRALKATNPAH